MHRVPGPRTNNDAAAGQKTRRGKSLNENREDEKNGESHKSGRLEGRCAHDCHAAGGIGGRGSAVLVTTFREGRRKVSAESIDKRHSRGLNGRQRPNRAVLAQRGAPWTKTRLKA